MEFSPTFQLTPSNAHHFFGYYSICPWSKNQRYYVCLETEFHHRMPKKGEKAKILLLDLKEDSVEYLFETEAWNFQQGSMLNWLPSSPNTHIIFNDLNGDIPVSRIIDIRDKTIRSLPCAISAVAHKRDLALCLNYSRLRRNRKVVSYPSRRNHLKGHHPDNDGIFLMDLKTGEKHLIISLGQIWNSNPKTKTIPKEDIGKRISKEFWFNHFELNPSDKRFFFLARYSNRIGQLVTSMWTINIDGTDPYLLVDFGKQLSHFGWLNDSTKLIVTMKQLKRIDKSHVILEDKKGNPKILAPKKLIRDGHPAINPKGNLLATDCYPIKGKRYVYIVDMKSEEIFTVASFENPPHIDGNIRCDPHPRWNRDGTQLSFDGLGPNGRQVYVIKF